MDWTYVLSYVVYAALFFYLAYALMKPEKF